MSDMIAILVVIAALIAIQLNNSTTKRCTHTHWAQYPSRKIRTCIDCGTCELLESSHYPNHQR